MEFGCFYGGEYDEYIGVSYWKYLIHVYLWHRVIYLWIGCNQYSLFVHIDACYQIGAFSLIKFVNLHISVAPQFQTSKTLLKHNPNHMVMCVGGDA